MPSLPAVMHTAVLYDRKASQREHVPAIDGLRGLANTGWASAEEFVGC
ncbi:hypothetical protein [Okibacterium endophyticum]